MPARDATLRTCSTPVSSISRMSGSLAYRTPGTRISPLGSIHHSVSLFLTSSSRFMSYVALSFPRAILTVNDAEHRVGRALWFNAGVVTIRIEAFTAGGCRQPVLVDPDQERAEHHLASRHLEDDGVEPLDEQVFERLR